MSTEEINKRREICNHCGIYDSENDLCNGHLYVNPSNNDVSICPKTGYIKGCGCLLSRKIPNELKHCPAKKW